MIRIEHLYKIHRSDSLEQLALKGINLQIERASCVALVGSSGSGKSTLLNLLAGLDQPSAGQLIVNNHYLAQLNKNQLSRFRRDTIGLLWQQSGRNLIGYLTAHQNVELLHALAHRSAWGRNWSDQLLEAVQLSEQANRTVSLLSGGQQQRVALACALANRPQLLLADEPTGELDWVSAQAVLELFDQLRERFGLTIVLVTHDQRVADYAESWPIADPTTPICTTRA
jgi:ABC-type lipoprotein export system ATPase subunit